jgi:transcriptional regulator with XRE-family HTH domain
MELKDWIRVARKAAKLTQEQLGERLGMTKGNVSAWENGRHEPSYAQLQQISEISGMPLPSMDSQHKTSTANASISEPKAPLINRTLNKHGRSLDEQDLPQPTEDEFAYVPQLDIAAACGNGRFEDHVVVKGGLAFKKSFLRDKGVPEHAARIVYAAGGSMSPTLQDGCVVLLNLADTEPRDGKVYAICKPDDGLVLKRLIWDYHPALGRQTWIMRSDNPDKIAHPDKMLPLDDRTMIAGRAVWNDNQL